MNQLTPERLRELMSYDPETGLFTRLVRASQMAAGEIAGSTTTDGYTKIRIDRRMYRAQRLAFLYMTGAWPTNQVDHINGVRDDNRWSNLRDVTRSVNLQNQRRAPSSNRSCGLLGVTWHKAVGKWQAQITVNGKPHRPGYFDTKEEAHAAYLKAKRELHPGSTL